MKLRAVRCARRLCMLGAIALDLVDSFLEKHDQTAVRMRGEMFNLALDEMGRTTLRAAGAKPWGRA